MKQMTQIIQDVGWTFKEIWRRTRGFVVTSINLIIFLFFGKLSQHMEILIPYFFLKPQQCSKNFGLE